MKVINGKHNFAKIYIDDVEDAVIEQTTNMLSSPVFKDTRVRIMPDTHAGKGSVVGFTSTLGKAIIPNVVGVDGSCGIYSWNLGKKSIDLPDLDKFIHKNIPHGFGQNESKNYAVYEISKSSTPEILDLFELTSKKIGLDNDKVLKSIGSLGGGNHFISIEQDEQGNNWLLVHSGSRNFGLKIANYYQDMAKSFCSKSLIEVEKDLEYLPMEYGGKEYLSETDVANKFAHWNRYIIGKRIINFLKRDIDNCESIFSIHNYINLEDNIIRKGATQAKKGQSLLIPLNMKDGTLICIGKGNYEWNFSAPHGAGRLYSRTKAKETLSMSDFTKSMEGIYSSCIMESTLDESPMSYKDMNDIIDNIQDTVEIKHHLKTIYNFKDTSESKKYGKNK